MENLDTILIHLQYIRTDIADLRDDLKAMKVELKLDDKAQWAAIDIIRDKVNKQTGVNMVLAAIIAGITTALVNLGLKK